MIKKMLNYYYNSKMNHSQMKYSMNKNPDSLLQILKALKIVIHQQ